MKIAVLNGSPKGEISVTVQYVKYLQKRLPEHDFNMINIGQEIIVIEKNKKKFDSIIREIETSDAVLWDFPVYFFLVPSQVKRFVELIFERGAQKAFENKYAASLSSSKHFFDHTAHNYINAICEDLNMKYVTFFSAEMNDLLEPENREQLVKFGKDFIRHIEFKLPVEKKFRPLDYNVPEFKPGKIEESEKSGDKRILISTDATEEDVNLNRMIDVFVKLMPNPVEVININNIKVKGGCLGCCRCAEGGECIYKDDFCEFFTTHVLKADILIYAVRMRDRYLSAKWKLFLDRSFFNGHRPILKGKQSAYIISGPLSQESNLREVLEAMTGIGRLNLAGIVTDEYEDSDHLTSLLKNLGEKLIWGSNKQYLRPWSFLGYGGHLVFRELVYTGGKFLKADYEYYKKNGLFDYPNVDIKKRLESTVFSFMLSIPDVKKKIYKEAKFSMIKKLAKIVAEV